MSDTPENIDGVRKLLGQPETVELADGMTAPEGRADEDGGGMDMPPAPPPHQDGEPLPPEADCAKFALNDDGNGKRFVRHFGEDILSVPRVGWFVWSGTHWKRDDDQITVRSLAQQMSERIAKETWYLKPGDFEQATIDRANDAEPDIDEIEALPHASRSDEQRQKLIAAKSLVKARDKIVKRWDDAVSRRLTHAKNAGNSNAMNNFIQEAAVKIARPLDDLDAAPLDINCQSGMLRFSMVDCRGDGGGKVSNVELIPHAREHYMTKIMPVDYDPYAQSPRFDAFLERIQPIPEMRRFLQRWFGLTMTALTGEQKFAFFHGSGANGKSVLVDAVWRVLGDYGASARIETLTGSNRRGGGDATPDLVPLIGARGVRTSEPDRGERLQEGLVKELTGGEPIMVRALHSDFILIQPLFKLTMSGNHKPEIHGGDHGIWRRVMLVDFPVQIPEEEQIEKNELDAILWAEAPGIFRWMVEGLLDYMEQGLQVPAAVLAATEEYREESDPFGAFLTLCCHVSGDASDTIFARDLTEAFNLWLDDQGRGTFKPTTVSKRLAAMAGRWKSPTTQRTFEKHKASLSGYKGISFSEPFGTRFRNMPRDQQGRILRNASFGGDA